MEGRRRAASRVESGLIVVLTLLASSSCHDSTGPEAVASLSITPAAATLYVGPHGGDTVRLTTVARGKDGKRLTDPSVTWSSDTPASATVDADGLVTAVAPGSATITAASGGKSATASMTVLLVPVASVTVMPDSAALVRDDSVQLSVVVRDAAGDSLGGRAVSWSSSDSTVAGVSPAGMVHAVRTGEAIVTATSEGRSGQARIVVAGTLEGDWSVVGARYTQGVQDTLNPIPVVLNGGAVAFDALLRADSTSTASMQVALYLTDQSGGMVWSGTAQVRNVGSTPSYAAPTVQFLVPAAVVRSGLYWQVVRDPSGLFPDDSAADDVFPRAGPEPLPTVDVPPLEIRFVPIVLAANDDATGDVSDSNIPEYLRTVRSIYPLGRIDAYVGTPLVTNTSFGTAPSGGDASFFQSVLSELDLARVVDTTTVGQNWYGIVRPPNGFNYTYYGGWSYIPGSGGATGPGTRTSVSVQLDWFSRPTQARDLVAHELGHTFGRLHAPCGGAGSPLDPDYPIAGGLLDMPGEDVYSWASGLDNSARSVPTSTGDVMGYCFPVWASTYTYRGILAFRGQQTSPVAALSAPTPRRVLVVRGTISLGRSLALLPAFVLTARPSAPERSGPYRLVGLRADGRELFRYDFAPALMEHDPETRPFTFAIPLTAEMDTTLAEVRLDGPEGEARMSLREPGPLGVTARGQEAVVAREPDGTVTASCPTGTTGVLVQAGADNHLLGTSLGATMHLPSLARGTPLTVICSDGLHTISLAAGVP